MRSCTGVEAAEVEVYVGHEITPGPFGWVVPTVDGRARVGVTAYDRPLDRLARLLDHPRIRGRNCRLTGRPVVAPLDGGRPHPGGGRSRRPGQDHDGRRRVHGLLAAEIAVDVLTRALAEDNLSAESLAEYDRRWRSLLGREIEVGVRFRQLARRVDEAALAFLSTSPTATASNAPSSPTASSTGTPPCSLPSSTAPSPSSARSF